jgi:hypothetical protein
MDNGCDFHSKKIAAYVRSMTKKPHVSENDYGAPRILAEMSRFSPGV